MLTKQYVVLIVDDDEISLCTTGFFFSGMNCKVLLAKDAYEALALLDSSIDLVVTDLRMPRMSGFELAQIIKHSQLCLPIIGMSTDSGLLSQAKSKETSMDELLEKPLTPSHCQAVIDRHLPEHGLVQISQQTVFNGAFSPAKSLC